MREKNVPCVFCKDKLEKIILCKGFGAFLFLPVSRENTALYCTKARTTYLQDRSGLKHILQVTSSPCQDREHNNSCTLSKVQLRSSTPEIWDEEGEEDLEFQCTSVIQLIFLDEEDSQSFAVWEIVEEGGKTGFHTHRALLSFFSSMCKIIRRIYSK